jgi:hypothetical protein
MESIAGAAPVKRVGIHEPKTSWGGRLVRMRPPGRQAFKFQTPLERVQQGAVKKR